jgi:hypothetical protein
MPSDLAWRELADGNNISTDRRTVDVPRPVATPRAAVPRMTA